MLGCRPCTGGTGEQRILARYLTWEAAPSQDSPCHPQSLSVTEKTAPGCLLAWLSTSPVPETQASEPLPRLTFLEPQSRCHSFCYASLRPLPGTDPGTTTVPSFPVVCTQRVEGYLLPISTPALIFLSACVAVEVRLLTLPVPAGCPPSDPRFPLVPLTPSWAWPPSSDSPGCAEQGSQPGCPHLPHPHPRVQVIQL